MGRMENRQDIDLVRLDVINNAVRSFEYFTDLRDLEFWDHSTGFWERRNLF